MEIRGLNLFIVIYNSTEIKQYRVVSDVIPEIHFSHDKYFTLVNIGSNHKLLRKYIIIKVAFYKIRETLFPNCFFFLFKPFFFLLRVFHINNTNIVNVDYVFGEFFELSSFHTINHLCYSYIFIFMKSLNTYLVHLQCGLIIPNMPFMLPVILFSSEYF